MLFGALCFWTSVIVIHALLRNVDFYWQFSLSVIAPSITLILYYFLHRKRTIVGQHTVNAPLIIVSIWWLAPWLIALSNFTYGGQAYMLFINDWEMIIKTLLFAPAFAFVFSGYDGSFLALFVVSLLFGFFSYYEKRKCENVSN